jgi:S1-C subfamily serine protease
VLPGSPAATAGLAAGDRVVRLAGRPVTSERALAAMLATPRRAPALVVYARDGWLRATELPPE